MTLRPLIALSLPLFLVACHTPVATLTTPPRVVVPYTGPWATANVSLSIPATRHIQAIEGAHATRFEAYVSGAGLIGNGSFENDWLPLTPLNTGEGQFGLPTSSGVRLGSISAKVPAGDRRIFRVKIYDATPEPDLLLEELWGVANIDANVNVVNTVLVEVKPLTTPTGKIFLELIKADPAKALTLPIENVQHFVEELTNTNVQGDPLRAGQSQYSPMVLNVPKATAAIIRGNAGVPFQIPVPVPDAMLAHDTTDPSKLTLTPEMRTRGTVALKVVDYHGQPVARPVTYYITDPATKVQLSSGATPADTLFSDVMPGSWVMNAFDMDRGNTASKPITVAEGQSLTTTLVLPPDVQTVAGSLDPEVNTSGAPGYNGEDTAPALTQIRDVTMLTIVNGAMVYWDQGNSRLRRYALNDPAATVRTIAGTGTQGLLGDGGPATAAQLQMYSNQDVAVDKLGRMFVSQSGTRLRMIGTDGTIKTFWTADGGWWYQPYRLAYDPTRHKLYMGCEQGYIYTLDLNVVDGSTPGLTFNGASPGTNGLDRLSIGYYTGSDLTIAGDNLYYVCYGTVNGINTYGIKRRNLATGTTDWVLGANAKAPAGDDTPATEASETSSPWGLNLDSHGNLYYRGNGGLYRITNANTGTTATNTWTVKRLTTDTIDDIALDPATDDLYIASRDQSKWMPWNGWRDVIRRLVP